jgi:hypothetical protein
VIIYALIVFLECNIGQCHYLGETCKQFFLKTRLVNNYDDGILIYFF